MPGLLQLRGKVGSDLATCPKPASLSFYASRFQDLPLSQNLPLHAVLTAAPQTRRMTLRTAPRGYRIGVTPHKLAIVLLTFWIDFSLHKGLPTARNFSVLFSNFPSCSLLLERITNT